MKKTIQSATLVFALIVGPSIVWADCQPQCTTYVLSQVHLSGRFGDAYQYWDTMLSQGYRRVSNGQGAAPPAPGDILVWQGLRDGKGHVAYVTSSNNANVFVMEANWNGDCKIGARSLNFKNGYVSGPNPGNAAPIGWLTRSQFTPQAKVPPPLAPSQNSSMQTSTPQTLIPPKPVPPSQPAPYKPATTQAPAPAQAKSQRTCVDPWTKKTVPC